MEKIGFNILKIQRVYVDVEHPVWSNLFSDNPAIPREKCIHLNSGQSF
jgi:hypothetical protein